MHYLNKYKSSVYSIPYCVYYGTIYTIILKCKLANIVNNTSHQLFITNVYNRLLIDNMFQLSFNIQSK